MPHNNDQTTSWNDSLLEGENAEYLEMLYEQYLDDPESLDSSWQNYFATLSPPPQSIYPPSPRHSLIRQQFRVNGLFHSVAEKTSISAEVLQDEREQVRVLQMIDNYRFLGHLAAQTNPLQCLQTTQQLEELSLSYHQLERVDRDKVFNPGSLNINHTPSLENIYQTLKNTYTRSVGIEYMHIMNTEEKEWVQRRVEFCESSADLSIDKQKRILKKLIAAEDFEHFLHNRYVGQKRFSLEGSESLIPLLDELIQYSGQEGIKELVLGMAHRGRLNVLINILGKTPEDLFSEFAGVDNDPKHTGDVKYHKGISSDIETPGGEVHVALAFNPSHLEIVSPVVAGSVRARQTRRDDKHGNQVLSVVLHGDAAFAGQGVVMETFNMGQTRGYGIHGTIHIVINNQIGFTTSTIQDSRSSYYATDVAKMVNAPIFHVNADDPEAVIFVAQTALAYRLRFGKDVVIDLVCYRRQGHNEADEPSVTQPMMYSEIRNLLTTRQQYSQQLIANGRVSTNWVNSATQSYHNQLEDSNQQVENSVNKTTREHYTDLWQSFIDGHWQDAVETGFDKALFTELAKNSLKVPEHFTLHSRVAKIWQNRVEMIEDKRRVDWGFAETMAYATLLQQGFGIRVSGQDSGRGTFFHRHAVIHNQTQRESWIPLKHLFATQPNCEIVDSLLSEEAVLAFEYGYATSEPNTLTIWEAQFGDFANGAQVVIDQFISSGEQKWGRFCGLVMLLPHGYEGMGPEHSSARLERYMQLSSQHNIQICVPSTPAQIFHLLRRQMLRSYRKPLIIMSPKSLLRHPQASSELTELTEGSFQTVIDDATSSKHQVTRIVLCSGKIYYDLVAASQKHQITTSAIIRLEQLYPFPREHLTKILESYPNKKELVWCQEEPKNQGAWDSIKHRFRKYDNLDITCVSRPSAAAPAVGIFKVHQRQQQKIASQALKIQES